MSPFFCLFLQGNIPLLHIFPWPEQTNLFWFHNKNINYCPMWVNYVAKGIVLKYLSNVCSYQVPLPPLLLSWISWIDLTDKMGNIFVRMSSVCQNPYFSPFHHVLVQCLESIMIFGYISNMTSVVYKSNKTFEHFPVFVQ